MPVIRFRHKTKKSLAELIAYVDKFCKNCPDLSPFTVAVWAVEQYFSVQSELDASGIKVTFTPTSVEVVANGYMYKITEDKPSRVTRTKNGEVEAQLQPPSEADNHTWLGVAIIAAVEELSGSFFE
tara:strand:+ start:601 stop:978 length:378 start_codon:yes stop_codon:yes gene_type:complete